jgi:hypothetical protein
MPAIASSQATAAPLASTTARAAAVTSGPMPSPGMRVMVFIASTWRWLSGR